MAEQERTLEPEAERDTKQEAVHEVESVSESAHLGVQDAVAAQEKDVEEVKVAEVEEAAQAAEDDAGENGDDVEIVEAALQAVPELLSAEALQDKPSPAQVWGPQINLIFFKEVRVQKGIVFIYCM